LSVKNQRRPPPAFSEVSVESKEPDSVSSRPTPAVTCHLRLLLLFAAKLYRPFRRHELISKSSDPPGTSISEESFWYESSTLQWSVRK
jgi:hypothetical protein